MYDFCSLYGRNMKNIFSSVLFLSFGTDEMTKMRFRTYASRTSYGLNGKNVHSSVLFLNYDTDKGEKSIDFHLIHMICLIRSYENYYI